jgi:hypothetical protein
MRALKKKATAAKLRPWRAFMLRSRAVELGIVYATDEKSAEAAAIAVGQNPEDYSVLENGVVVGRIFLLDAVGPQGRPWMWASGHGGHVERAAHGYEPTREAAMAAFAKSWRSSLGVYKP